MTSEVNSLAYVQVNCWQIDVIVIIPYSNCRFALVKMLSNEVEFQLVNGFFYLWYSCLLTDVISFAHPMSDAANVYPSRYFDS